MSVRVMTAVWALVLPDSEKIVLLALADSANDEGHCWPGMKSLMAKCSKSDRTIQAAIKSLCVAGHLTRREVLGKGCNYTVHPARAKAEMQGYNPPEVHYVYKITNAATGEFYIGARSCVGAVLDDDYMGSGNWVKEARSSGAALSKTIIEQVASREALGQAELLHVKEVYGQALCKNAKLPTPGTLSQTGYRGVTPEATSPRSDFAPKGTTPTPEAASGKPLRTTNTEAKASLIRVFDHWNVVAAKHGLHIANQLNASRTQMGLARLKEHGEAKMIEAVDRCGRSAFCRGETGDGRRADIMMILQPKTLARLFEGYYGEDEVKREVDPKEFRESQRRTAELYDRLGRTNEAAEIRANLERKADPMMAARVAEMTRGLVAKENFGGGSAR